MVPILEDVAPAAAKPAKAQAAVPPSPKAPPAVGCKSWGWWMEEIPRPTTGWMQQNLTK